MCHRVCKSLIYSNEKNEPHLFPYHRAVVHFMACYGYNVDRWSFPPKDGVSRQKTRPNGPIPTLPLCVIVKIVTVLESNNDDDDCVGSGDCDSRSRNKIMSHMTSNALEDLVLSDNINLISRIHVVG